MNLINKNGRLINKIWRKIFLVRGNVLFFSNLECLFCDFRKSYLRYCTKLNLRYWGKPNYLLSTCFQSLRWTPDMDISCKIFLNLLITYVKSLKKTLDKDVSYKIFLFDFSKSLKLF